LRNAQIFLLKQIRSNLTQWNHWGEKQGTFDAHKEHMRKWIYKGNDSVNGWDSIKCEFKKRQLIEREKTKLQTKIIIIFLSHNPGSCRGPTKPSRTNNGVHVAVVKKKWVFSPIYKTISSSLHFYNTTNVCYQFQCETSTIFSIYTHTGFFFLTIHTPVLNLITCDYFLTSSNQIVTTVYVNLDSLTEKLKAIWISSFFIRICCFYFKRDFYI
jgi:hypothetical protein